VLPGARFLAYGTAGCNLRCKYCQNWQFSQTTASDTKNYDLTADQSERLAAAINTRTGRDVEVRVVIDPSVLGGVVTEIGDDIIDGSVRRRLNQLRESFR